MAGVAGERSMTSAKCRARKETPCQLGKMRNGSLGSLDTELPLSSHRRPGRGPFNSAGITEERM